MCFLGGGRGCMCGVYGRYTKVHRHDGHEVHEDRHDERTHQVMGVSVDTPCIAGEGDASLTMFVCLPWKHVQ